MRRAEATETLLGVFGEVLMVSLPLLGAHEPSIGTWKAGSGSRDHAGARSAIRARRPVFLNGKFYSGVLNGVHRTADQLIRQLDVLCDEGACPDLEFRLLLPRRPNWAPALRRIRKVPQPLGHHQVWEQAILPFAAAGGVLVNLANLAPIAHGRKISMIHDAQFAISPESFRAKVRLGYRLFTPLIGATSVRVLTVSEYARDSLVAFGIAPHRKTEVVYNGADHIDKVTADPTILQRFALEPGGFVLMFGSAAVYKNVQVVFEAFSTSTIGPRLVVVGPSRDTLVKAGLRPPCDAVFAGLVGDEALKALYQAAICLLFPSRTEGFGLPPVEAMTCGCPVVAAPAGAIPEICRDAVLYADIFSPETWAAQIDALRRNPDLRKAKIDHGQRRAAEFRWRIAAQKLLNEIYRSGNNHCM